VAAGEVEQLVAEAAAGLDALADARDVLLLIVLEDAGQQMLLGREVVQETGF
jgi:hypothetical protein